MNKVRENLRALLDAKAISENELGRQTKVPQPTIHRILSGNTADPRDGTLRPIASFFNITVEELRTNTKDEVAAKAMRRLAEPIRGYEVRGVEGEADFEPEREVLVEEIEVFVSAGLGDTPPEFVETKFRMPYQMYWFNQIGAKPENVRLMKVRGHSMERTLFDGDRVAVHLAEKTIVDGRVYVFVVGGGVKVKRLYTTSDGRIRIVSDNPDKTQYPDEYLHNADFDHAFIVGRVVDRSGRGGL